MKIMQKIQSVFTIGSVLIIVVLAVGNVIMLTQSMSLSDKLVHLENNYKKIQKDNETSQAQLSTVTSLGRLETVASALGFVEKAEPIHLDEQQFAELR